MNIWFCYYLHGIKTLKNSLHCCYRGGRYAEEDAKVIVVQILSVVAFCHLQGVVHRDLKPEVCYHILNLNYAIKRLLSFFFHNMKILPGF